MELSGSRLIPASQQRVWDKLVACGTLKACITGCERLERISDNEYLVGLHANYGPVWARFQGRLKLTDIDAPNSYHLVFEGDGGAAGSAKGYADVKLTSEGDSTRLSYTAHADLQGSLSQLKTEQAEKIARKMTDNFFALFSVCASRAAEIAETPRVRAARPMPSAAQYAHRHELAARYSWVLVAGVVAAIVVYHTFLY
jgi:carbon monoxide dehydrogenase subunit G